MKKNILAKTAVFVFCLFILNATIYAQWREPQYVNMHSASTWNRNSDDSTTISICWENPQGFETGMQIVREAVEKTWQAEANLEFSGWGKCETNSRGVRILIKDEEEAPHTNGLGKMLDGKPAGMVLNFTFNNWRDKKTGKKGCSLAIESCIKFITVHEFGHALGLAHEHNRTDCRCEEEPQGTTEGTTYITACDMESVMNYCNKNNYGVLSNGDKEGIRIVYGEKRKSLRLDDEQTLVAITDELTSGQVTPSVSVEQLWENVYVEIGGTGQLLHIDKSNLVHTQRWSFSNTGSYRYKVWSYTIQKEFLNGKFVQQVPVLGYGEGEIYLTKGKFQTFSVTIKAQPNHWNPAGYMNLFLDNADAKLPVTPPSLLNPATVKITVKEIEQSYQSNLIDETINKAKTFLQAEPNNSKVNAILGFCLLSKRDIDNAVTHLERAVNYGETITFPLKTVRIRGILKILFVNNGEIVIFKDKVGIKEPDKAFGIELSALTTIRLDNYQNQCPIVFMEGMFTEFKENSSKTKQEAKSFNLFPTTMTLQPTVQNNIAVNVIACNDEGIVTTAIVKLLNRLKL